MDAFLNIVSDRAEDAAVEKQRKSVQPSDVYKALEKIGLGDIVPGIQAELKSTVNPLKALIFILTPHFVQHTKSCRRNRELRPRRRRMRRDPVRLLLRVLK